MTGVYAQSTMMKNEIKICASTKTNWLPAGREPGGLKCLVV